MNLCIILSAGRSGSTLLQGILNGLPGFCIRGENGGLLPHLVRLHARIQASERYASVPTAPTNPWFGCELLSAEKATATLRSMLLEQLAIPPHVTTFGFKEIRWLAGDLNGLDLWTVMQFAESLYPTQFILLTRAFDEIYRSGWWASQPRDTVFNGIKSFYTLTRSYPYGSVFSIDYSDLTKFGGRTSEMFEFLGTRMSKSDFEAIISQRHSYATSQQDRLVAENVMLKEQLQYLQGGASLHVPSTERLSNVFNQLRSMAKQRPGIRSLCALRCLRLARRLLIPEAGRNSRLIN